VMVFTVSRKLPLCDERQDIQKEVENYLCYVVITSLVVEFIFNHRSDTVHIINSTPKSIEHCS
jgi:hypothetical protein